MENQNSLDTVAAGSAAVSISGDQNLVAETINAGRDVVITYGAPENAASLDLTGYLDDNYFAPSCTTQLLDQIVSRGFCMLFGKGELHLPTYAKYLVAKIHARLPGFDLKELRKTTGDTRTVPQFLRTLERPTVLIVDDLAPLDVLDDLAETARLAKQLGHIVIGTTQLDQATWALPAQVMQQFWFDMPESNLYEPTELYQLLLKRLDDADVEFDQTWQVARRDQALRAAAQKLQTPSRIGIFVLQLQAEAKLITVHRFEDLLEEASASRDQFISAWYQRANEKQKLLLLAATLFQGLGETEFFECLDKLVEARWQHRIPALLALDYCDLDEIRDFVAFERNANGQMQLSPKIPGQELSILRAAIRGFRRHAGASLPTLVQGIENTIGLGNVQPYLQNRRQLGSSLARLALVLPDVARPFLLDFARSNTAVRQRVAAIALASWRGMGYMDEMLAEFDLWVKAEGSTVGLRYTAMMALSYAAGQDHSNHLHPGIMSRIKERMKERSKTIQGFVKYLIPSLLRNHPLQIAPMMLDEVLREKDIQDKKDYIESTAEGLALAYLDYPVLMAAFLEEQMVWCQQNIAQTGAGAQFSYRDRKLVAVLTSYTLLDYERLRGKVNPMQLLTRIAGLRAAERQPMVKASVMKLILRLMLVAGQLDLEVWEKLMRESEFAERIELIRALQNLMQAGKIRSVAPYLNMVLNDLARADYSLRLELLVVMKDFWPVHFQINAEECMATMTSFLIHYPNTDRIIFVRIIGQIYLDCRETLPQGDFSIEVEGRNIPIFRANRPLTQVEQYMYSWLSSDLRQCRKVSMMAWMEFGRIIELRERDEIRNWRPEPVLDTAMPSSGATTDFWQEAPAASQPSNSAPRPQAIPQVSAQNYYPRIPLRVKLVGCMLLLFSPDQERRRFWQAVQVIFGRPQEFKLYNVHHATWRLHTGNGDIPRKLGQQLLNLRRWVGLLGINM